MYIYDVLQFGVLLWCFLLAMLLSFVLVFCLFSSATVFQTSKKNYQKGIQAFKMPSASFGIFSPTKMALLDIYIIAYQSYLGKQQLLTDKNSVFGNQISKLKIRFSEHILKIFQLCPDFCFGLSNPTESNNTPYAPTATITLFPSPLTFLSLLLRTPTNPNESNLFTQTRQQLASLLSLKFSLVLFISL